jgi:hypothetical protein
MMEINPLNIELNHICPLLALLAHHILHVSRIRVEVDNIKQYERSGSVMSIAYTL